MDLFTKIDIPKGKRVLTKVVNNQLLVYFTHESNVRPITPKSKPNDILDNSLALG
jgi:hypothetical protein